MHNQFKLGYDKLDSFNYPNISPEEIDYLLNKAQDRFVKQRYSKNNTKRESFEEIQKRTDDLKSVVKTTSLTPQPTSANNISVNAQFVILPIDYWFTIYEKCIVTYNDCHNTPVIADAEVRVVKHDNYNNIINNPFEKPNQSKVLRLMSESNTEIIHALNTTVNSYFLRYIKKPIRISITTPTDCELSDHTHEEIVNEAVSIALETLETLRVKTFDPIIKNQEE